MKILIIIPAYNEAKNIESVIHEVTTRCPQCDYIIINDSSTDDTEEVCIRNKFNYLTLSSNLGIGGGVQTGYLYAKELNYDITIQIDGDGQHNPIYINEMIKELINNDYDMVIGSRFCSSNKDDDGFRSTFLRRMGIQVIRRIIKLCCGANISDTTSGFRICNKRLSNFYAINYAQDYPEPEAIVQAVLNGFRIKEYPVVMKKRKEGQSSINVIRSIYYMIKVSMAILICRISVSKEKKS